MVNSLSEIDASGKEMWSEMQYGPLAGGAGGDRNWVIEVLNDVLATELVCVLRCKRHYHMADGPVSEMAAAEFQKHARDEQRHTDMVAARIVQLQGEPEFDPDTLQQRSHSEYMPGSGLADMIREDLVAEWVAAASYQEIIRWLATEDPTSRRILEEILADEEEHAESLQNLLDEVASVS